MAALAARQHGVVSRSQLLDLGLGPRAIEHRLASARLIGLHPGVYAAGHTALRREGRWMAAALAYQARKARLGHHTAAAAWELMAPRDRIDLTVPGRGGVSAPPGLRLHRTRSLPDDECGWVGPLPVTSVARTLLDLAATLDDHALEQVIHRAEVRGRFDLVEVRTVLARYPRRHGSPRLAATLDRLEGVGAQQDRSGLETALRRLCSKYGLPAPAANARLGGYEVDFYWPGTTLVVETDGAHHRMPEQRERDYAKRLALEVQGLRVVGLTHRQVTREPARTASHLRMLIDACQLNPAYGGSGDTHPRQG